MKAAVKIDSSVEAQYIDRLFEEIRGIGLQVERTTGTTPNSVYFEIEGAFLDRLVLSPRYSKTTKEVIGYTLTLPWKNGTCFQVSYPTRPDGTFKYDKIAGEIVRRYRVSRAAHNRFKGIQEDSNPLVEKLQEELGSFPSYFHCTGTPYPDRVRISIKEADFNFEQAKALLIALKTMV